MKIDFGRVWAVVLKEIRDYRHNRLIIVTMALLPVIFVIVPTVNLFTLSASSSSTVVHAQVGSSMLLLLLLPVIVPATIAAYSVVGEREQGTLEPLLTTPISRDELLLGKALAAVVPAVAITYILFAIVVVGVRIVGASVVVHAVWQAPQFLAELLFAPLLATWAIWIGMAISARSSDIRVSQQLGTLASLPALAITTLISYRIISPTLALAFGLAAAILVIDVFAWRIASRMFDRERLILGRPAQPRSKRGATTAGEPGTGSA